MADEILQGAISVRRKLEQRGLRVMSFRFSCFLKFVELSFYQGGEYLVYAICFSYRIPYPLLKFLSKCRVLVRSGECREKLQNLFSSWGVIGVNTFCVLRGTSVVQHLTFAFEGVQGSESKQLSVVCSLLLRLLVSKSVRLAKSWVVVRKESESFSLRESLGSWKGTLRLRVSWDSMVSMKWMSKIFLLRLRVFHRLNLISAGDKPESLDFFTIIQFYQQITGQAPPASLPRIKIIIMDEGYDSDEDCFIPTRWEHLSPDALSPPPLSINSLLSSANDLHKVCRPLTLKPRTCFPQLSIKKLPLELNLGHCIGEVVSNQNSGSIGKKSFASMLQREYSSFEDFTSNFEEAFDKMRKYKQQIFSSHEPYSRFKQIPLLSDYHEALFPQLKEHESPQHKKFDAFESAFECGNLAKAYKIPCKRQYVLLLENDINSHGYASWFFFRVQPMQAGAAQFHIVNLAKQPYMHRLGMKIAVFSKLRQQQEGLGWHWAGSNIQAYRTGFQKRNKPSENYYGLSFEYTFCQEDEVYFAYNQPYTYSRAIQQIQSLVKTFEESEMQVSVVRSISSLCYNVIPIIEISKPGPDTDQKKTIVFMARQHPAEVVGSFIMEALMKQIESMGQNVSELLEKFNIVLIPFVNPDGVIHGNSRCNLAGLDLNRNWHEQLKGGAPECIGLRKYLWSLHSLGGILMVVDLHGHSKKMNSFLFCSKPETGEPNYFFPFLFSKLEPRFDFSSCTFGSTPDKQNTLRCQFSQSGMLHCYTFESSYFGLWQAPNCARAFGEHDFHQIGFSLLECIKLVSLYKQSEIIKIAKLKSYGSVDMLLQDIKRQSERIKWEQAQHGSGWAELQSESDPEGDILNSEQMDKLLSSPNSKEKKFSISKKNIPNKKEKVVKKNLLINGDETDDIQRAHSIHSNSVQANKLSKYHRSEKKINPPVSNEKPCMNHTKLYSKVRPKKSPYSEDIKQKVIHTKNITIGDQKGEYSEIKNKVLYSTMCVQPLTNSGHNKTRTQFRFRTELFSDCAKTPQRKLESSKGFMENLKTSKFKQFADKTFQINKVDTPSFEADSPKPPNEKIDAKLKNSSSFSHKGRKKTMMSEQCDEEAEEGKRTYGINFEKELARRKKKLMSKLESGKYQRFQNFKTEGAQKSSMKAKANSVFYYFPIL